MSEDFQYVIEVGKSNDKPIIGLDELIAKEIESVGPDTWNWSMSFAYDDDIEYDRVRYLVNKKITSFEVDYVIKLGTVKFFVCDANGNEFVEKL